MKITIKKYNGKVWTGFFWLRIYAFVMIVMNLQFP
jgi:hypothetical protein